MYILRYCCCLSVLALSAFGPTTLHAQGLPAIGAIGLGANQLLKGIIAEAEQAADKLVKRAADRGDLLAAKLAGEMQLSIANAKVILGDLQQKTFSELDLYQKSVFVNLNRMIERVNAGGTLRNVSELAMLDAREVVNRLLISKPGADFYVSSVRGTTLFHQQHEYVVQVTGLGFGFKGNNPPCVVDVIVDGSLLDFSAIRQTENHQVYIHIPAELLEPKYQDDKMSHVPFVFTSAIGGTAVPKKHELKLDLVLLPRNAGKVHIDQVVDDETWVEGSTYTIVLTQSSDGEIRGEWTAPDNALITSVDYIAPEGPASGFSYSLRYRGTDREYAPDFDILDSGRSVRVYRFQAPNLVCKYVIKYKTKTKNPKTINVADGDYVLKFGSRIQLDLASNNSSSNFRISGTMFDGRIINTNSEVLPTESDSPLKLIGIGRVSNYARVTIEVPKPWDD